MITNFDDFKNKMNESVQPSIDVPFNQDQLAQIVKVEKYCKMAVEIGLSRNQTEKIIEAFADTSKAPEEINVHFVKNNLDTMKKYLSFFEDSIFGSEKRFSSSILESKNPFELVMYIPTNSKINELYNSLNNNIKKDDFKVIYEHDIFYINNFNILNENNKNVVLSTLKSLGAINISNQLKWTRIIS